MLGLGHIAIEMARHRKGSNSCSAEMGCFPPAAVPMIPLIVMTEVVQAQEVYQAYQMDCSGSAGFSLGCDLSLFQQ